MTKRTKTTVATLGGAVALSSVAFALGSQAGGGSADAATATTPSTTSTTATTPQQTAPADRVRKAFGAGLSDLASDLGVTEGRLRDALEKVREAQQPKDPAAKRDEHTTALAQALGISAEKVEQAFEQLRSAREDEHVAALAKALGVSEEKVRQAFADMKPDPGRHGRRGEHFSELAKALGVSEDKLRDALQDLRPARPDRDDLSAELAKALGVSEEQLEQAQEKLRDQAEAEFEQRRKELAAALAKELGIDEAEVTEALEDRPFLGGRGFGHGPGGGPKGVFGRGPR